MAATMAIKIKTIPYRPEHKQLIIDLLDSKPFKREIWEWQFMENPLVYDFNPVVLVDRWDTIIGFNGIMPVRIQYDDEIIQGLWSCDFFVDSRYQGKGCESEIKRELHTRAPLIMALGSNDMGALALQSMRWQKINIVDSYKKLNRITDVKSMIMVVTQFINQIMTGNKKQRPLNCEIVYSETLPDATMVNQLWNNISEEYNKIVVRDYPYLHWRYEIHPLVSYRFISAFRNRELAAFIVIHITEKYVHLVDYVGPAVDYNIKAALLEKLLSISSRLEYLSCSTSDGEWKHLLQAHGFCKQPEKLDFFVYSSLDIKKTESLSDWFIMEGDSDIDILRASEEGFFSYNLQKYDISQSRISVKQLTEEDFLESESQWNELIKESDADPLFLGWAWQFLWWRQWSKKRGYSLYILAAYADDNKLVGLAPLYKSIVQIHPFHKFTQLQFIGSSWGNGETVRTEYLDFIVNSQYAYQTRQVFLNYLNGDKSWDQFILSDIKRQSLTMKLLKHLID